MPPGLARAWIISQARLIASQTSRVNAVRAARALSRAAAMHERIELGLSSLKVRKRRAPRPSRLTSRGGARTTLRALSQACSTWAWPPRAARRMVASTSRVVNSARSM